MKTFGQIAYEAYSDHRKWFSFHNEPLPAWSSSPVEIREAWEVAAQAAIQEADELTAVNSDNPDTVG
jgi:hypothetical protein